MTAGGVSYGLKATIQIVTRKMNDRKSYRVTSIAPSLEETNRLPLLTTPACIIGSTDKFSTAILAHLFHIAFAMRPVCLLDRTENLYQSDRLHFISDSYSTKIFVCELLFYIGASTIKTILYTRQTPWKIHWQWFPVVLLWWRRKSCGNSLLKRSAIHHEMAVFHTVRHEFIVSERIP